MNTAQAKARIEQIRENLSDANWTHDMSESGWRRLTHELCDLAAEYVWLREESES